MKWGDVRRLYPDKFIKLKILESHILEDKEYINDVSVIKVLDDDKQAMREFIRCKENEIIFSTVKEELVVNIRKRIGIRVPMESWKNCK